GPGVDQATTTVKHGAASVRNHGGGAFDRRFLGRGRSGRSQEAVSLVLGRRVAAGSGQGGNLNIFGEVQQHRTGAALGTQAQGLGRQGGHVFNTTNLGIPLGHRAGNANRIALLESGGTNCGGRYLTTNTQDRNRIRSEERRVGKE